MFGRFDRYMLAQLLVVFGFSSIVLVLVYWINRAVRLFDQLIASGQSAGVFLEFTALSLPNVIRLVLPISAFAATIYVANRMASESETVVLQSTGFGPRRLLRPVLVFGVLVALFMSVLTHVLVPASLTRLFERQVEVSENITGQLLSEGRFLNPAPGVTFYIREITPQGELLDIFMSDRRADSGSVIYTASRALLIRDEGRPKLLMFDGMAQTMTPRNGRLAITGFRDFALDITSLLDVEITATRRIAEMPTPELLRPQADALAETGQSAAAFLVAGHKRITGALLALLAPVLGYAVMLLGGFSRFGVWNQILGAVIALIAVQMLDNAMTNIAQDDPTLWPLTYAAPLAAGLLAAALLWYPTRPRRNRIQGAAP